MRRVFVDRDAPQRDAIQEAAKWIRNGGLVAIPTDTLYGLAADPFNAAAVARVFLAKGRLADRALPLVASDAEQVAAHLVPLGPDARSLAERFWPGPLTVLVHAPVSLPASVTGGTGRVGVRVPAHDIARAICRAVGRPVTATSANVSGAPATSDPDVVEQSLGEHIDLLIDTGPTTGGAPSTIVDVTEQPPRLVREGAIRWTEIEGWLRRG
jgi:L-threonylcarbamoyladenylate synthase